MEEKVKSIIAEQMNISPDDIGRGDSLRKKLNADSLDLVELLVAFEDAFGIYVSDEEAVNIDTVDDIIRLLEERQA